MQKKLERQKNLARPESIVR